MVSLITEVLKEADDGEVLSVTEREIIIDIQTIQVVAADIESQDELIKTTEDPELESIYSQGILHTIEIYKKLSKDLFNKLKVYLENCEEENIPVNVGYYRIYKVLKTELVVS